MIRTRFKGPFEGDEDWTIASFEGTSEEAAWNILATRLYALDFDILTWDGVDWIELGEEE